MTALLPTRRDALLGTAATLFAPIAPAWSMTSAGRAPSIVAATGVVLAAESTLRRTLPWSDPRFIGLEERGPTFTSTVAAHVAGAERDRAREGWGMEVHHPCAVDELPRPAHAALARLQAALSSRGGLLTIVADAVDDLHERSGLDGVIHAQGLRCRQCGRVEDHRADRGLFRGADCPTCGGEEALWRYEPTFWTGGRMSRGDGVSDLSRLRAAVAAADLVIVIGEGDHDRARHGMTWAAKKVGTPVFVVSPSVNSCADEAGRICTRWTGAVDDVVPTLVAGVLAGLHDLAPATAGA